ncbi:hypothetical protein BDR26DRAFT_859517 [Obelidium mucronatum]|nr:hypothetical protein BDR26DRAFT_859517 [Obelidium mucronatum]
MERLSAMLQRKEQELLLQKEREAAENNGQSTLELKLKIQQTLKERQAQDQLDLLSVTASPKQTRSNVLGLLARRVNNTASPLPPSQQADVPLQSNLVDIRRPSIDVFMANEEALRNNTVGLAQDDIIRKPVAVEAKENIVDHFKRLSGLNEDGKKIVVEEPVAMTEELQQDPQQSKEQQMGEEMPEVVFPSRTTSKSKTAAAAVASGGDSAGSVLPQVKPISRKGFMTLKSGAWGAFKAEDGKLLQTAITEEDIDTGSDSEESITASSKLRHPGLRLLMLPQPVIIPKRAERALITEGLKECYLFLFNDILLITKPYERRSSKRIYFKPLTIINLQSATFTFNDPKSRHPNNGLLLIDQETRHKIETVVSRTFEAHPVKSISYLISKGIFPRTPSAVATFLLTTPRLSKIALGKFLALQSHALILQSYMRFLNFNNMDLVPCFRMLLCCFRLPTDESDKVDIIIDAFVDRWLQCNPKSLAKILPPFNPNNHHHHQNHPNASKPLPAPPTTTTPSPPPPTRHWQHDAVRQVVFGLLALDFEVHYAQASIKEETVFLNRFLTSLLPQLQLSLRNRPDTAHISATTCEKTHREALCHIFNSIVDERLDMGEVSGDKIVGAFNSSLYWIFTVEGGGGGGGGASTTESTDSPNPTSSSLPTPSVEPSAPPPQPPPFTTTTPFLNLTEGDLSPLITLRISQPVPGLQIQVSGVDVVAEPAILDFRQVACVGFRVRGLSSGRKVLLFTRRFNDDVLGGGGGGAGGRSEVDVEGGRGLENPAGLGVLVEPAWLKYRFVVDQNNIGVGGAGGGSGGDVVGVAGGAESQGSEHVQVLAVANEEAFGEWEETVQSLKSVSKDTMTLAGNNPYGTIGGDRGGSGSGGQQQQTEKVMASQLDSAGGSMNLELDERIQKLRAAMLGKDQPLSRSDLLKQIGAVAE